MPPFVPSWKDLRVMRAIAQLGMSFITTDRIAALLDSNMTQFDANDIARELGLSNHRVGGTMESIHYKGYIRLVDADTKMWELTELGIRTLMDLDQPE